MTTFFLKVQTSSCKKITTRDIIYNTINTINKQCSMLYMKIVKEESEKFGFKLNIQKTKIMASGPITSWGIDG